MGRGEVSAVGEVIAITPTSIGLAAAVCLIPALLLFVALIGWIDGWLIRKWGNEASISRGMERLWKAFPWIPAAMFLFIGFLLGLLTGHFGWPQSPIVGE